MWKVSRAQGQRAGLHFAGGAGIFYKSLLSVGLLCAELRGGDRALNYGQNRKMRFSVGSDGGSGSKLIGLFY